MVDVAEVDVETPSLWEQTQGRIANLVEGRKPAGVCAIINRGFELEHIGDASNDQIKLLLKSVPSVFPENWKASPGSGAQNQSVEELTPQQKEVLEKLQTLGRTQMTTRKIEAIIHKGVLFRKTSRPV